MHYGELVRRHARRDPGKVALIDRGQEVTYRQLDRRTDRLANAWLARGLERGDRVALLVDNGHEAVEAMIAATKAGLVHVPIDFRLSAGDVRAVLTDCGARALVVGPDHVGTVRAIRAELAAVERYVLLGDAEPGFESFEALIAEAPEEVPATDVAGTDLFCILYTSGTTGRAKGVVFDHDQAMDNSMAVIVGYDVHPDARYIVSYPHNSAGSVNHVFGPVLIVGGTLVLDEVKQFSAQRFFSLVDRYRATHGQLVPTMVFRLLGYPDRDRFDTSSLTTLGYASAPISPDTVRKMLDTFGPIFVHGYGMTETCSIATVLSKEDHAALDAGRPHVLASCGRPTSGVEVRVVDDAGADVPTGCVGEIIMRGRWLTRGYWDDPERTAEAIRGGWLYSGDLGRLDDEGYLYIVDRKKDLIITGGANVASTEVEAVLYGHPDVLEAAVIGVPDPEWGERVHAVVALVDGGTVTAAELVEHCRGRLAHFKAPKSVEVRAALPKTSTGKLAKAQLRAEHRAAAAG